LPGITLSYDFIVLKSCADPATPLEGHPLKLSRRYCLKSNRRRPCLHSD